MIAADETARAHPPCCPVVIDDSLTVDHLGLAVPVEIRDAGPAEGPADGHGGVGVDPFHAAVPVERDQPAAEEHADDLRNAIAVEVADGEIGIAGKPDAGVTDGEDVRTVTAVDHAEYPVLEIPVTLPISDEGGRGRGVGV